MSKPALGRGLGALLGGNAASKPAAPAPAPQPESSAPPADAGQRVLRIKLDLVKPSPLQPRKDFTPESLDELAASIKEQGIVQPLIVRQRGDYYELIAGERRWRAAQLLHLNEVPAIVREADDRSVLELALIENLQRENLNPMEEALGYEQLMQQFQLRQEDVAIKVGKSRVAVANALRLLKLAPDVQTFVRNGRLSVGHGKVILSLASTEQQKLAAERILKDGLSVRAAEELVAAMQSQPLTPAKGRTAMVTLSRDANVVAMENKIRERLGTKVQLRYKQGKGAIEIKFFNEDDLQRVLAVLGVSAD
jgi:ParB family chromosome partitioning protein